MSAINELLQVMKKLRDPDSGCPWDRAQSIKSIAPYTIEEAYEVVEAIETASMDELCDELGDLLFHIVFYSEMASEAGHFDFETVCRVSKAKLVRRHPHVFDNRQQDSAEAVEQDWEKMKSLERAQKALQKGASSSVLADTGKGMPALLRAEKLQKRAASVGFDWKDAEPVREKILEEIEELKEEVASTGNRENIEEELGDLLFSCVNLARHLKISPETALRQSNRKFEQRFSYMERQLQKQGSSAVEASLEHMEELWSEAKKQEVNY